MRRIKLFYAALTLLLAWTGLSAPVASAASPDPSVRSVVLQPWFTNETTRTLTLAGSHASPGCFDPPPPQRIPPGGRVTWFVNCGPQYIEGYVTYTVNGSGGQGYAYMPFHLPNPGADPFAGTRAGGLFTLDRRYEPISSSVHYTFRCLSPVC
ncbi:hypothetical protein ACFV9P_04955 [Streptomyces sp. NPDC059892]|uniref:hypothetical protein n=1 Tax=Streptomyces sp. NPDC059892 TaxID=3346989 RepID=UPI0036589CDA